MVSLSIYLDNITPLYLISDLPRIGDHLCSGCRVYQWNMDLNLSHLFVIGLSSLSV
jgi:hypothetical protein